MSVNSKNLDYVNAICGWQYPGQTIKERLHSKNRILLTIDFDFPCQKRCNLNCKYCFVKTDERELENSSGKHHKKLSIDELKSAFRQAAELGCKSAKLVGDQEPLLEKDLIDFLNYTSEELKMWVVIFTNGLVLADDRLCKKIHGMTSREIIDSLKNLRVSIMIKFHSFSNDIEDELVGRDGYSEQRNQVLDRLIDAGYNNPPQFGTEEEQVEMTGVPWGQEPRTWTRLGLESVITPQCLEDVEKIYWQKVTKRLYIDLDPPVPVGITRSDTYRQRVGVNVTKKDAFETCLGIYKINKEIGIPFEGASPYFGSSPCSQLPYGLYVNARGRIYPCCGCPEVESDGRSEYLGHVSETNALERAIRNNPYRLHFIEHGFAYDKKPFNSPDYSGYGIFHGCPYRDNAGDILPEGWEVLIAEKLQEN